MNSSEADIEIDEAVLCTAVEDIFRTASRKMFESAARDYCDRAGLTPLDIFYSLEEQRKLYTIGTYSQDIIQKIARAQIKLTTASVSARMKTLWELVDQHIQRNQARQEEHPPVDLKTLQSADALVPSVGENEAAFGHRVLSSIVATALAENDKGARFENVLQCARRLANQQNVACFDTYLAELTQLTEVKTYFIDDEGALIDQIKRLLGGFQKNETRDQTLAALFSLTETWRLTEIPDAILTLCLECLDARTPFVNGAPQGELEALCEVYALIQNREMSALKRQEFDTRIARRLRQIVNDETIEDFMGEAPDILERIQVFAALQRKLPVEALAEFVNENIKNLFTDGFFRSQIPRDPAEPIEVIKKLASTARALDQLNLPQGRLGAMTAQIEDCQNQVIDRARIFEISNLKKAENFPRFKLIAGLIMENALISESYRTQARTVLQKILKTPNFVETCLTGLSNQKAKVDRARELHDLILGAGLAS